MQLGDEENIPFVGWVNMSEKVERDKKIAEVNVPFLVSVQKLNDAIFGFNTIKHLVQNKMDRESLVSVFQKGFDKIGRYKMEIFVELL